MLRAALKCSPLLHAKESGISSGCGTKSAQLPFIPQETGISNYVPFFFVLLFHSAAYNDNSKLFTIKTALSWPNSSTGWELNRHSRDHGSSPCSGSKFSGLSCNYFSAAENCRDHKLKIHFNLQFTDKNIMYQRHLIDLFAICSWTITYWSGKNEFLQFAVNKKKPSKFNATGRLWHNCNTPYGVAKQSTYLTAVN